MTEMPVFTPLSPHVGARVEGVTLNRPLAPETVRAIEDGLHRYGVLLFRDVALEEDEQIRLARHFGRISRLGEFAKSQPDALYVSNARDDGILGDDELTFHSDKMYQPTPPKAAILYALEVPAQGGHTIFSGSAHIARTLEPELRARLAGLKCRHRFRYAKYYGTPDAKASSKPLAAADADIELSFERPVIERHPFCDQEFIAVNIKAPRSIQGVSEEESRALVAELARRIEDPANQYRQVWKKGDLIFWDNFLVQHARTAFDSSERRTLRRCQIAHDREPEQGGPQRASGIVRRHARGRRVVGAIACPAQ